MTAQLNATRADLAATRGELAQHAAATVWFVGVCVRVSPLCMCVCVCVCVWRTASWREQHGPRRPNLAFESSRSVSQRYDHHQHDHHDHHEHNYQLQAADTAIVAPSGKRKAIIILHTAPQSPPILFYDWLALALQ